MTTEEEIKDVEKELDKEEKTVPLEVKITNKDKSERDTTYDSQDANEYDVHTMSKEEIEEFENGNP